MVRIEYDDQALTVCGQRWQLRFEESGGQRATLLAGGVVAELFLLSSCNADCQPDYSYGVGPPTVREVDGGLVIEITSASSLWQGKKYAFFCTPDRLEYFYSVRGVGAIDDCEFFQGFLGEPRSAGTGRPWIDAGYEGGFYGRMRSKALFPSIFNPEPNGLRRQYFAPSESSRIGVRSDKSYCRGNWFFTPGPFCYVLRTSARKWLTLGLAVKPGQNNFVEYHYRGGNGFGLSLSYEGKQHVDGTWESPHVILLLADDEYAAVQRYCDYLRLAGCVPNGRKPVFDWWREPIFCGWGAQSYLSWADGRARLAQDYATQANYERFIAELERRGLDPGTIVVDDKWQKSYGDPTPDAAKWPALAAFVERQHAVGRKVLLWLKAWDAEGLPPDECLVDGSERPLAVDPTNPFYEKRLRRRVRELIGGFGADGFKIDFTASLPSGRVKLMNDKPWGVELLRRLLWIIYSEAKSVKEDALIVAHTVNPYFADVVDMVRLNDIAILPGANGYVESMVHRQKVARAASNSWLIDMDNWPSPTLASWLEYMRWQPHLGVPSLYYVTHIDESGEEIGQAEMREVAALWAAYRDKYRLGNDRTTKTQSR